MRMRRIAVVVALSGAAVIAPVAGIQPALAVSPPAPSGCSPVTTTFSNSTPVAIPTGPAVVSSTIVVSGVPTHLWDLDAQTFITHTFAADLDITLQSPAGTVVTLTTDNGAGNDDVFNGTVWDDDANPGGQVPYTTNNGLATDHAYVNLTTATPLVPEEAMGAFIGENPNGTWTVTISDDLAGDGGSLNSWSLTLVTLPGAVSLSSTTFSSSTPVAIPTGPAVVTASISVSGAGGFISDLDAQTFITHTFAADLDITLQSPAGTVVTLTTDNGAGNDNVFDGTVWDDSANPGGQVPYTTNNGLATDHAYVNLTTATPLVPEEAMGAFIGENPTGTWTLTVSDDLAGDGGSINSWSLTIDRGTCSSGGGSASTLTVAKVGTGVGTVTSTPSGIACPPDCQESYATGTLVDLSAHPGTNSTFRGWGGACTGTGTCRISISANSSPVVSATFDLSEEPPPGPSADLSVTGAASADPQVGSPLTYTFTVANAGPDAATGASLAGDVSGAILAAATLEPQGTASATQATQEACTLTGSSFTCALGDLASSAGATVTVAVTPYRGGTHTASATVSSAVADPNAANDATSVDAAVAVVCTVTGTLGDDALTGTAGIDVICAKGGNDTVVALGGNDIVLGGPGVDTLGGGEGDDLLKGGPAADALKGGPGTDVCEGGGGANTFVTCES